MKNKMIKQIYKSFPLSGIILPYSLIIVTAMISGTGKAVIENEKLTSNKEEGIKPSFLF